MVKSRTSPAVMASAILLAVEARRPNGNATRGRRTELSAAKAGSSVFGCGTSLHHAQSILSPSTLCPTGEDSCPANQHCYAGLTPSSDELRQLHSQLTSRFLSSHTQSRLGGFSSTSTEERFVCGSSWEQAVQSLCQERQEQHTADYEANEGPIHCPFGSSSCPANMECYASVSCPVNTIVGTNNPESSSAAATRHAQHESQDVSHVQYEMALNLSSPMDSHEEDEQDARVSLYQSIVDYSNRRWNDMLGFGSC